MGQRHQHGQQLVLTGQEDAPDVSEVLLGKQKANIPQDMRKQFPQSWGIFLMPMEDCIHHGHVHDCVHGAH
jgi:hypothetical protein